MLRLKPFEIYFPREWQEACSLLKEIGPHAKICAGGTDLLPNMKHELHEPKAIVHLERILGLRDIVESDNAIVIGAMARISSITANPSLQSHFFSLIKASENIASPQIRNMGTIGGNLCLDTRCLFYNQTHFWRESIGFCLKKCGDTCHVTKTGKRCVAAASNDLATVLLTLDARVEIGSPEGIRTLGLDEFYVANGEKNTALSHEEIITHIIIPKAKAGVHSRYGFMKLRNRKAIDFPMLSIASRIDQDEHNRVLAIKLCVNALAAKPKAIEITSYLGQELNEGCLEEIAESVRKKCIPLINICDDEQWRRDMVKVYVKRAFQEVLHQARMSRIAY